MVMNRRLNPDDAKQNARAGSVKLGPKKNRNMYQTVNYSVGSQSNPGSMYQNRPASGGSAGSVVGEAARRASRTRPTGKNRPNQDKGKVIPGKPGKNKIPSKTRQRNSGGR
jgi:hypothetical protein